ncbi:acyl carrier protein [Campylobacter volucris]|uniref:acyl carrier protein n=1 Tax=Campylobacter volucris TaxID=1031542 RepID=UPI001059DD63|nr:acyl carrier protein [Campylobacter volucris]MBF7045288.1 acyl carrier protein [Campylobacter volucris]TDJ82070.1 acyl carrier protein [Campylobacter volucris]
MNNILEILQNVKPGVDYKTNQDLVSNGIISSFDILQIIMELEAKFDIEIQPQHIEPENFNSASAIMAMVERIKNDE